MKLVYTGVPIAIINAKERALEELQTKKMLYRGDPNQKELFDKWDKEYEERIKELDKTLQEHRSKIVSCETLDILDRVDKKYNTVYDL